MDKGSLDKDKEAELRRKVFVGGINKTTTEKLLEEYFSNFGEIEDILVNRSAKKGVCKGCAFVLFKDEAVAQQLIRAPEKHEVNGKMVECKEVHKKGTKKKAKKSQDLKVQEIQNLSLNSKASIKSQRGSHCSILDNLNGQAAQRKSTGQTSQKELICFKGDKSESSLLQKVLNRSQKIAHRHRNYPQNLAKTKKTSPRFNLFTGYSGASKLINRTRKF
jgi:RNA recognition motif-containing protein